MPEQLFTPWQEHSSANLKRKRKTTNYLQGGRKTSNSSKAVRKSGLISICTTITINADKFTIDGCLSTEILRTLFPWSPESRSLTCGMLFQVCPRAGFGIPLSPPTVWLVTFTFILFIELLQRWKHLFNEPFQTKFTVVINKMMMETQISLKRKWKLIQALKIYKHYIFYMSKWTL